MQHLNKKPNKASSVNFRFLINLYPDPINILYCPHFAGFPPIPFVGIKFFSLSVPCIYNFFKFVGQFPLEYPVKLQPNSLST